MCFLCEQDDATAQSRNERDVTPEQWWRRLAFFQAHVGPSSAPFIVNGLTFGYKQQTCKNCAVTPLDELSDAHVKRVQSNMSKRRRQKGLFLPMLDDGQPKAAGGNDDELEVRRDRLERALHFGRCGL